MANRFYYPRPEYPRPERQRGTMEGYDWVNLNGPWQFRFDGARLEVNCLPDAAGGRVPAPLLAHRLLRVVHRVFHAQDQQPSFTSAAGVQRFGQVELEGGVAPFVVAQVNPVAPGVGEKIRRPDVENHPLALPRLVVRHLDFAAIPAHFVTGRRAVIAARHFQRVSENARRVVVIIAGRVAFSPCRK